MADINPIRYRGYYYDSELGFYYLQSRYYDPNICRFINADGLASTGQGFLGCNMFSYCNNNPVNRSDPSGKWPEWLDNTINKAMKSIEDWLSMRSGTITEGISFSFSPGQYSMGYQLGSSIDTYGNYSLQFSEVSGYASSAGASVTMFVSATNAKNTDDLEQDATQIGANLGIPVEGIPVCAGADYATIPNKDDATQPYHGISFNAGLGTPGVEIHDENCYTSYP